MPAAMFEQEFFYGLHVRWNLHSVYDILCLDSHGGHRWVWVAKNWEQWVRFCQAWLPFHSQALCKSQQDNKSIEDNGEDPQRCLLWPSASTFALLALLVRSFSGSQQQGGFSTFASRFAAKSLFRGLIDICASGGPFEIPLMLDSGSVLQWPHAARGCNVVKLSIGADLQVDFTSVVQAPLDVPGDFLAKAFSAMEVDIGQPMHIVELVSRCASWKPRPLPRKDNLMGQLLFRLAQRLDMMLAGVKRDTAPAGSGAISEQPFDAHKCTPAEMSRQLICYWQAQQAFGEGGLQYLSLAADKSRVFGCSLLSTCLAKPSGEAVWAFLQAVRAGRVGSGAACTPQNSWATSAREMCIIYGVRRTWGTSFFGRELHFPPR